MSAPSPIDAAGGAQDGAGAVLGLLVRRSREGIYEGFLHELGTELGLSPTRVSRAVRTLRDADRIEVLRRGHGAHPSRLRVLSPLPLIPHGARSTRPALADRLLEHLNGLSNHGVVERPLVEVARELDVGAPSVSRALGRLVDEGLARVDQVGTRGRPTRIALAEAGSKSEDLARLRSENERLAQEVARLRERLGDSGA